MDIHLAKLLLALPCLIGISRSLSPAVAAFAQAHPPRNSAVNAPLIPDGAPGRGTSNSRSVLNRSSNSFLGVR